MQFNKSDIPILDSILDTLLKEEYIVPQDVQNKSHFKGMEWSEIESEFNRLMYFFEYFGCARCKTPGPREINSEIRVNSRTQSFKSNGGFKKAFEDIEKESLHQEKIREKEINDGLLSKWKVKTFWWLFIVALLGFGLSLYNFIDSLSPSKKVEKQEQRIEQLESDLSKLRILISRQKSRGSLINNILVSQIPCQITDRNKTWANTTYKQYGHRF
ncbi:MAG: hypothetical protein CMH46_14060 [Muricauda sp.]|nr:MULTISPECIES: hypothetical protein [unclassified Allomuricauda]MAU16649.1 hypothetical protein [Allomuricauda sp.]|tara:strand:- start:874 stop:1518 length:645 start_codon:yes stop_codon:yes gene_type:complete